MYIVFLCFFVCCALLLCYCLPRRVCAGPLFAITGDHINSKQDLLLYRQKHTWYGIYLYVPFYTNNIWYYRYLLWFPVIAVYKAEPNIV